MESSPNCKVTFEIKNHRTTNEKYKNPVKLIFRFLLKTIASNKIISEEAAVGICIKCLNDCKERNNAIKRLFASIVDNILFDFSIVMYSIDIFISLNKLKYSDFQYKI